MITQPEPRSVLLPGPRGRGCQTRSGRDKDPPRPWPGAAGQRWSGVFADAPRQRPRWGGGRGTAEERRPPARGAPAETRAGWTEPPPTAASLSPPYSLPCLVGFSSLSPTPTGFRAGAAQRKPISGRQPRPALAKQPPGRDEERPELGISSKVDSRLVGILLRSSLTLCFRSASLPCPSPAWRPEAGGAMHCGGCSPGMRKRRHVLLTGSHLLRVRRRRCVATGGGCQLLPENWKASFREAYSLA